MAEYEKSIELMNEFFNIEMLKSIIVCYFFIVNIICLMYETGKKILETHLTYKELQQENQTKLRENFIMAMNYICNIYGKDEKWEI